MSAISFTIDEKSICAEEGTMLLWVALQNGIYIPNLCALRERTFPFAGCRLCFVEIAGYPEPVTACTEPVREGLVVRTQTEKVLRLQRTATELILSAHEVDCGHCRKNKQCELQRTAFQLKVKLRPKRLRAIQKNLPPDNSHPLFTYDPNKCVLCGRCVWVCREQPQAGMLNFASRGFDLIVTTFGHSGISDHLCKQCGKCVDACPVGALMLKLSPS